MHLNTNNIETEAAHYVQKIYLSHHSLIGKLNNTNLLQEHQYGTHF